MMRRALMAATRSSMLSPSVMTSVSSTPAMLFTVPRRAYPAQDFVDNTRSPAGHVAQVGRAWKIDELRLKSFDDLHTLWFVLLKEKNMLLSERERCRNKKVRLVRPDRLVKVRQSMARIMAVMDERKKVQLRLQEYQKEHLLPKPALQQAPPVDVAAQETTTA